MKSCTLHTIESFKSNDHSTSSAQYFDLENLATMHIVMLTINELIAETTEQAPKIPTAPFSEVEQR